MLSVFSAKFKSAKKGVTYDFSSVQFDLPKTLADRVKSWGKENIAEKDVFKESGEKGRENEIHVTVKYGLHTTDVEEVKKNIKGCKPFSISLGAISRFVPKDKEYDVVKIDIEGEGLHDIHRMLGELKNSDEHPEYRPHCTVAYIKKGQCSELSGDKSLSGAKATVNRLTFSSKDDTKYFLDL